MYRPKPLMTTHGMYNGIEVDPDQIRHWAATPAQVRDCILRYGICAPAPELPPERLAIVRRFLATPEEVEAANAKAYTAITNGRLLDFGFVPNDAIIRASIRGGPLFNKRVLCQPFQQPWMFMHIWYNDVESADVVSVYLVDPDQDGSCGICELTPMAVAGTHLLSISDRTQVTPIADDPDSYSMQTAPAPWRVLLAKPNNDGNIYREAASNVIDPMITALLILATRNVQRETIRASDKLQHARRKSNKSPIPPYDVVHSAPYITALTAKHSSIAGEPHGSTHASPIPHIRMGHIRHYKSGVSSMIQDTLVNVAADQREAFKSNRSHYTVKAD